MKLNLLFILQLLTLSSDVAAFTPMSKLRSGCSQSVRLPNIERPMRYFSGRLTSLRMASDDIPVENVAVILLAGGVGSRMKANQPKQFLELLGKPVLMHTLELFLSLDGIARVVLVIDAKYESQFEPLQALNPKLIFAPPGKERQDSVFNGLQKINDDAPVVCIHDAARPLITPEAIYKVLRDGIEHGAAVLGVPMKATVKESEDGEFVLRTIDRSRLWEIQTPQVIKPSILMDGFKRVNEEGWEVTDDVSIVEQLGVPVKLTLGEYTNLKLTTPDDMQVAEQIMASRA